MNRLRGRLTAQRDMAAGFARKFAPVTGKPCSRVSRPFALNQSLNCSAPSRVEGTSGDERRRRDRVALDPLVVVRTAQERVGQDARFGIDGPEEIGLASSAAAIGGVTN